VELDGAKYTGSTSNLPKTEEYHFGFISIFNNDFSSGMVIGNTQKSKNLGNDVDRVGHGLGGRGFNKNVNNETIKKERIGNHKQTVTIINFIKSENYVFICFIQNKTILSRRCKICYINGTNQSV
jgi:hypothetical protein